MHQPAVVNTREPRSNSAQLIPVVHTTCPQSKKKKLSAARIWTHGLTAQSIHSHLNCRKHLLTHYDSCVTAGVTAQSIHSHLNCRKHLLTHYVCSRTTICYICVLVLVYHAQVLSTAGNTCRICRSICSIPS
jgi:hypothetical protein